MSYMRPKEVMERYGRVAERLRKESVEVSMDDHNGFWNSGIRVESPQQRLTPHVFSKQNMYMQMKITKS